MSGLINEIQKACLNDAVQVGSLLRQVKLAASKLNLGSLENWVDSELNGYDGELPTYRIMHGQPAAWNPYHGWIPVQTNGDLMTEVLTKAKVGQSIGGLRDLIENGDSGLFHFPVPPEIVNIINESMSVGTPKMVVQIPRGGIIGILETVRNKVLDWAIEMERNGVIGEGFSFGPSEVENAKGAMTTYNIGRIGSFSGNLGTGNSSGDISLTSTNVTKINETMHKLREAAPNLVEAGASASLPDIIDAVIAETDRSRPDVGTLKSLTEDVRTALVGAAGSLTAEGALTLVGGLLRMLGGG